MYVYSCFSLKQMVSKTKVVVTCAGTFSRYGSKLVEQGRSGCRTCSECFFCSCSTFPLYFRFLLRFLPVFYSVVFFSVFLFRFCFRFLPWRGGPFRTPSLLQEDKAQEARFPKSHDHIMAVQKPFQIASFRQLLELDVRTGFRPPRHAPLAGPDPDRCFSVF